VTGVADNVLTPGNATRSDLVQRLSRGAGPQMPALGTEIVDPYGEALLTSWVDAL
jgi:hypothetical protein